MNSESISLTYAGMQKTYALTDVSMIQAKKGSAGKWALGCGGGCLGLYAISYLTSPDTYADAAYNAGISDGALLLGCLFWVGVSAGVGALIGSSSDHYQIVYSKNLSYLQKFDLNFSANRLTRYTPQTNNFTLTYRF